MSENNFKSKSTFELCEKLWIGLVTTMTKNYVEKGVPLIRNSDIKPNRIRTNLINLETGFANLHIERMLRTGDVVTVHTGDVGVSAVIPIELNGAHGFATINSRLKKEEILPEYYSWFLNSNDFIKQVYLVITGDGRNNLNLNDFVNLNVNYPNLSTQRRIAQILSTCDAVIEKTQAAIDKYKAIKQGMLHDLFTRGIDPTTGKLRPKYEDAPELYKESKLGMVPKEWGVERLENLCAEKPTYGINAAAVDFTHQLPTYIRITDIDEEGNFSKTGRKCVDSPFSSNYFLKKGDLVFARTGATVGKTYLYNEADGLLVFAGFLIKITPDSAMLDSNYLKFLTETSYYLNWVGLMSQRSGQPGINGNEYGGFLVPKPDLTEQKNIAAKLLTIQSKIKTEQSYFHKLQSIKQGLMNDLLSGKKRVKVSEEVLAVSN